MLKRGVVVACWLVIVSVGDAFAAPVIEFETNPFDVGTAVIDTSVSKSGTLTSSENSRVDLAIASCTGAEGMFAFDRTSNINLNTPQTVVVTYTPVTAGVRTCTVNALDTGTMTVLDTFQIRGGGLDAQTLTLTAASITFSSIRWNDAAPIRTSSRNITGSNGGDVPLAISDVSISGMHAGDFSITAGGTSATIAAGGARTWTIQFNPSAAGTRTATLTFTSDAANGATQTVALSGVGTNAIIGVNDAAFGIVNTGSSAQLDISVANNGAMPKGNLGVTSATISGGTWFTFAGCGGGTSCTFSPALSIATSLVVGVRCSPPAGAGLNEMQTAMVTFNSDTDDAAATPDTVAMLSCTAGQSSLATNQSTVSFPSTLVGTTTTALTVTVTNNGNVDALFYLQKTGLNQAAYTLSTPSGCGFTGTTNRCVVPANMGTATFSVTFLPTFEGDISAGVTLVSTANLNPQIVVTGRGIDRHISVADTVQAPDTFRNPGDMAPLVPVEIANSGEYPLHVSNILLGTEGQIWQLAEPFAAFDVPGLDKKVINVRFAPEIPGKAPDGTLVIMSDDRTTPMKTIIVSGNGKDRNVSMGPAPIDFFNTGAGVPVLLSTIRTADELLTVRNLDDTLFKVRELKFDQPDDLGDAFTVVDENGNSISNLDLPPGGMHRFDIVFAPPKVGRYTRQLTLFLDQDPLGQRTIEVRGTALFVDARGGGGFGCSASGGAGAGVLVALLALRRRRRA